MQSNTFGWCFEAFDNSFRTIDVSHIQRDATREVISVLRRKDN